MEQTGSKHNWNEPEVSALSIWETCAIYKNNMILDVVVAIKAITMEQLLQSLGVSGLHSLGVSLSTWCA